MAKRKKAAGKQSKHRASWKGNLTFGLVSFPVQAFNAFNREQSDIHFHQLHAKCHRRIHYQKVCPVHGELPADEIVSGYEYAKGKYVEVEPEELDALATHRERSLTIDTFIEPETIDPIYLDGRMYYLLPSSEGADEPYSVMAEAMEREERYGIGQVVLSGKEQLAMVRSVDGVLHMAMLNYNEEIKSPESIAVVKKPRGINRQVQLAQALIRNWSSDEFDFAAYDDHYRKKIKDLIKAKVQGREIVTPGEVSEPIEVVNLLDALKRSVAQASGDHKTKRRKRRSA